jgi:hypothetical protein
MNPFTLPTNDSSLYVYREKQRVLKSEHEKEVRAIPIYHRSPEVKVPILAELRKSNPTFEPSPSKFRRNSCAAIREDLQELIQRKRDILLVKKSIENKVKNIEFLQVSVTEREKMNRELKKRLEEELHMFEKFEEKVMQETRVKAENSKKKYLERVKVLENLEKIQEEIEFLVIKLEKKGEELKKYEKIKEFVEEVFTCLNQKDDVDMFITQEPGLFKSPAQLVDLINSFESKSLYLVNQVQTDEHQLENLKSLSQMSKADQDYDLEKLETQIKSLEKQKEILSEKLKKYGKVEKKEDNVMDEGTLNQIYEKLDEMIEIIGIDPKTRPGALDLLEKIENDLKAMTQKCLTFPEESVKKLEKEIDKNRRADNVEKLKEIELEKIRENDLRLKMRKNKRVKKHGRTLKPKSKIEEKVIVAEVREISQDVLDRIEFFGDPFTGK